MPVYAYKCLDCGAPDLRVTGVHDEVAVCHLCSGSMLRQSQEARDALQQYFRDVAFKTSGPTGT